MKYRIRVQGNVDASWSDWFDGMEVSTERDRHTGCTTTFTGVVEDQATLRGILNHLWDLNLTILSVIQVDSEGEPVSSFDDGRLFNPQSTIRNPQSESVG